MVLSAVLLTGCVCQDTAPESVSSSRLEQSSEVQNTVQAGTAESAGGSLKDVDLSGQMEEYEELYDSGKALLKTGEEPELENTGIFSYGHWTTVYSFTTNAPFGIASNNAGDTVRAVSNGYTYEFDKETLSGKIQYNNSIQQRCKYYTASDRYAVTVSEDENGNRDVSVSEDAPIAVKITVDDNGVRSWIDKDGNVLVSDGDFTEWVTTDEFTTEEPQDYYEKELERVVPTNYEAITDDDGYTHIVFHYIKQTREKL